jgi:hypothetical protein
MAWGEEVGNWVWVVTIGKILNSNGTRTGAEGRRRKAEGGRQKAEGRRQKAEGRRQRAEGRRQKAEGRRQKAEISQKCTQQTGASGVRSVAVATFPTGNPSFRIDC